VYQYTFKTVNYLKSKNLLPELIQVGNEINCGMFITAAPAGFPTCNSCNNQWQQLGDVLNSAIAAVKDATSTSSAKPKILLHVADPKNLQWWFDNIRDNGKVTAFDIIGFSYYPLWHTTIGPQQLQATISSLKTRYQKPLMILETAYPWSTENNDSYNNIFGSQTPINGYPFTKEGQLEMMKLITQAVVSGGGVGVVYWEPAWITSETRDLWGKGSSWENTTFFDFTGNTLPAMDYTKHSYKVK
jgi:arabinogalactan endo-1,4-beta-galactosidase